MKMPRWFKTALALALVLGPMYWLLVSNDGQRRSDAVMLWLFGADTIELDLRVLDDGYTREQLRKVYPDLAWECSSQAGSDNTVCSSALGTYNTIPAYRIVFHFSDDQLTRLRVDYRPRYHQALLGQLVQQLGQPADTTTPQAVLEWPLGNSLVVVKRELTDTDDAALFWLRRPVADNNKPVPPNATPNNDR